MNALFAVILLAIIIITFGVFLLVVSGRLGPKRQHSAVKDMPYESGLPGTDTKDTKVSVKFYLTAILFIIFDIEIVFMYPWAVTYLDSVKAGAGIYLLGAMGVFILLFVIGLIWEIKSKALEWD
ncbi:MAG: NADH-quinone oxidoreductase subunit A [Bdellovibrionaceae bacterium]|nr:NADH-quinone oxidoreductase subunit A [Pseudobdellovibrionaceae bacterium]